MSSEIAETEEEAAEVSISDIGIGISPKNPNRLLQIGVQYTISGTAQEKGTGLSLIICTVCFTLPLSKHHS